MLTNNIMAKMTPAQRKASDKRISKARKPLKSVQRRKGKTFAVPPRG